MSQRLVCPECDAPVRVSDNVTAGKRVRCPECKAVFAAEFTSADSRSRRSDRDDEDGGDRPRRKKKARGGPPMALYMGLGAGGLIVVVLIAVVLIMTLGGPNNAPLANAPKGGPKGGPNAAPPVVPPVIPPIIPQLPIGRAFTHQEMQRLQTGMTEAEAEKILGAGRPTNVAEAQAAYREVNPNTPLQTWTMLTSRTSRWLAWGNKAGGIYAGFATTKKNELRLTMAFYTLKQGNHIEFVQGAKGGVETINRKDEEDGKIAAFDKDARWATGPKVRELVLGKWKRDYSELELKPGGGIRTVLPLLMFEMRDPIAYRFRDDVTMEIDAPDVFKQAITRTAAFRVYVSPDEMYLRKINTMPNLPILWDGPYRRVD